MGTDSVLYNKKTKETVYCDRFYNLSNSFVEAKGLSDDLQTCGLTKFIIVNLCTELISLFNESDSIYHSIINDLSKFDDDDIFILISDNDDRYWENKND